MGGLWGRSVKAEGLINRVGGLINYNFLDKAKITIKSVFSKK